MESLNIVDGIVIVIVLISAILAYARGVTREVMAIMGWIFSSIISFFCTINYSIDQRNPFTWTNIS